MSYLIGFLVVLLGFNIFVVPPIEQTLTYLSLKEIEETPKSIGIEYEDMFFKAADGTTLHGWFMDNPNSKKVLVFFHGNGGNISHRLQRVKTFYDLPADIFIVSYHGYGKSEGEPSENNLYLDGVAAYDFLSQQKHYLPEQIIPLGESLGGAVAIDLAARQKVGRVILLSTFTSFREMADNLFLPLWVRPFVWTKADFNSLKKIGQIKAPILIIHSKKDEIAPYEMALRLYAAAAEPKKLLSLEEGGHNDWLETPELLGGLREFLK